MENKYTKQFDPRIIEPNFSNFSPRLQELILPILADAYLKQQNGSKIIRWCDGFDPRIIEPQWDKFAPHVQALILPILIQAHQQKQQPRPQPISPLGIADTTNMVHRLRWGNMQGEQV